MKIIFICTKSITFNTFLKSQADYFIKKGIKIEVGCSDSKKLNTDIWYEEETYLWVKAAFEKTGYWEYRIKKIN